MLEQFKELTTHPYVISAISLFIAFYIFRDTVGAIIYIFTRALDFKKHTGLEEDSQ